MFCFKRQLLKQEGDRPKRQGLACLTELPKLKLSGVAQLSYSSPALQSVFGPGGKGQVPVLRPLKCVGVGQKVAGLPTSCPERCAHGHRSRD